MTVEDRARILAFSDFTSADLLSGLYRALAAKLSEP